MKTIFDESISCPVCGGHTFIKFFADDGLYICEKYVGDEKNHENSFAKIFCKSCNKDYPKSRFIETRRVFECKECGQKHWGLTEYYRDSVNFHMQFDEPRKHRFLDKE